MSSLKDKALEVLRESLNDPGASFHKHQWKAISKVVKDRSRLLVVQRTGWGKSAVYFISTKLLRDKGFGPTIIISPLLALMRNQIESVWHRWGATRVDRTTHAARAAVHPEPGVRPTKGRPRQNATVPTGLDPVHHSLGLSCYLYQSRQ